MELNFPSNATGSMFNNDSKRKTYTEVELDKALEDQSFQDLDSPEATTPVENLG